MSEPRRQLLALADRYWEAFLEARPTVVLGSSSVSLPVLRLLVDDWVDTTAG